MYIESLDRNAGHSQAALFFSGSNFDPEKITARLGLTPTHQGRVGELTRSNIPRPWSVWTYSLDSIDDSESVGELFSRFTALLRPKEELILSITREEGCECNASLDYWIDTGTSGFACESSDLMFISRICSSLSIIHFIVREQD